MKTYEIRTSRIVYDFYEVKANSQKEAEELALSRKDKVRYFEKLNKAIKDIKKLEL